MSEILSAVFIVVFVCFAASVNNKTKKLKDSGASEIEVNFTDGSICGKVEGTWTCDNMYVIKVED